MNDAVIQYGIGGHLHTDIYNLYSRVIDIKAQYTQTPVIVTITCITKDRVLIIAKDIDEHCTSTFDVFKWILTEAVYTALDGNTKLSNVIYNRERKIK